MSTSTAKSLTDLPVVVMLGHRSPWPRLGRSLALDIDGREYSPHGTEKGNVIRFPEVADGKTSSLHHQDTYATSLCMKGTIRTLEKCRSCGQPFGLTGRGLECRRCKTFPRRYFIDFWWQGQRLKVYTGKDGHALDSWARATRLLESMRAQVDAGTFHPKDWLIKPMSFQVYLEEWLKKQAKRQEKGEVSYGYLKSITNLSRRHLAPFFGQKNIRDIYEGTIDDFLEQLPDLSPKMVKNILGVLHKILKDALRRRDISQLPVFPTITVPEAETKWLTQEEQEQILAQISHPVYRAYYLLLMRRGIRPGEARALQWKDIDFKKGVVTVKAAMDVNQYRPSTKEKDIRYFPLPAEVAQILETFPRPIRGGFVFTIKGRPLTARMASSTWARAAKRAGISVSCYQGTKHSLGTELVDRGVSLEIIAAIYGHKSTQTTKRYAKVSSKRLKEIWDDSDDDPDRP